MTRVQFTELVLKLLARMKAEGEEVFIDYCKRSDEEQHRLFKAGLSKCDGYRLISQHQRGKAIDLCFVDENGRAYFLLNDKLQAVPPKKGFAYWHDYWTQLGGRAMIEWDKAHFEA